MNTSMIDPRPMTMTSGTASDVNVNAAGEDAPFVQRQRPYGDAFIESVSMCGRVALSPLRSCCCCTISILLFTQIVGIFVSINVTDPDFPDATRDFLVLNISFWGLLGGFMAVWHIVTLAYQYWLRTCRTLPRWICPVSLHLHRYLHLSEELIFRQGSRYCESSSFLSSRLFPYPCSVSCLRAPLPALGIRPMWLPLPRGKAAYLLRRFEPLTATYA